jgi:hypothetical protein
MDDTTLALFLATVATATAALVAIVGGLLVSRVVSLATESSGLAQRHNDLTSALGLERHRRTELAARLLRWDAFDVLGEYFDELAAENPQPDLAAWLREAGSSRTVEEVTPFLEEAMGKLQEAREVLLPLFAGGGRDDDLDDAIRAGEVDPPPGEKVYYEDAWWRLKEDIPYVPPRDPFGIGDSAFLSSLRVPTPYEQHLRALDSAGTKQQHEQLARDVAEADHRVDSLLIQREQVELALARVTKPKGVNAGLMVLGGFAVAGAVVPLWLLLYVDILLAWTPFLVLGLFAGGLAALLLYVAYQVNHLTDANKPPQ